MARHGDTLTEDLKGIERHYAELVEKHGAAPEAAQWSDSRTQRLRLQVLSEVGDLRAAKVLDFGCGTGALLAYLTEERGFTGEYVGYDLALPAVELARRLQPTGRFERRDVLSEGVPESFDFILASGVFNNRTSDGWALHHRATRSTVATRDVCSGVQRDVDIRRLPRGASLVRGSGGGFHVVQAGALTCGRSPSRLPGQAGCDPVRVHGLRVPGRIAPGFGLIMKALTSVRPIMSELAGFKHGVAERFVPDVMRCTLVEAEHLARYRWAAQFARGRRVLDAGCGTAYGSELLATEGAAEVGRYRCRPRRVGLGPPQGARRLCG